MFETVEKIYRALGIESTWLFVLIIALGSAAVGGGVAWIVDRAYKHSPEYKAEHPDPKQRAVIATASNPASQAVTVQSAATGVQGATSSQPAVKQKKEKRFNKSASAVLHEQTVVAANGANLAMIASVLAGNPVPATYGPPKAPATASPPPPGMIACANGKFVPEHHAKECGASNVTERYNTFEGGALPSNLSDTSNASINNNLINGPQAQTPPNQPNNTVRNMDASVSNGASASNNLFEGRPNTGRTLSSVADQLAQFIDSAHKIVAEFLEGDNSQLISEKEKAWEAEARSVLLANLGQRFADRFSSAASTSTVYPQGRNAQGGSVCNLIDAKVAVLSTFINQLRAAGN
jgi:hypothetical protein